MLEKYGDSRTLIDCLWESTYSHTAASENGQFLTKKDRFLLFNPGSPRIGIYPREMKTYVLKETYAQECSQ